MPSAAPAVRADLLDKRRRANPLLTLVVPVYNEEVVVNCFVDAVDAALNGTGIRHEFLFVDDGSGDGTRAMLEALAANRDDVSAIFLSRNFGKESALTAGIDHARGDIVVPIDVDLQDPPALIPRFVEKWREGYDVVYGVRMSRDADTAAKRITATTFYRIFNRLAREGIPPNTGDFRLIDRKVVNALRAMPENNRFMKGLFNWVGFRSTGVPFERPPRTRGTTKWNYWKLWNFAIDGFVGFTTAPLRLWLYIGALVSILSFVYAGIIVLRVVLYGIDVPGYASLITVILFLGGVQLLSLGTIGEYLARLFVEAKRRPCYIVDEIVSGDVEAISADVKTKAVETGD